MMEHLVLVFHATSIPIDGGSKSHSLGHQCGLDLSFPCYLLFEKIQQK